MASKTVLGGVALGFYTGDARLQDIRRRFCESIDVAEELVPLGVLRGFFEKHAQHARLPVLNPGTSLFTDSLPLQVVDASCRVLRGRTLPALASRCAAMFGAIMAAQVPLQILNTVCRVWPCNTSYSLYVDTF